MSQSYITLLFLTVDRTLTLDLFCDVFQQRRQVSQQNEKRDEVAKHEGQSLLTSQPTT